MSTIDKSTLLEALRKIYQSRTPQEHRIITNLMALCFPTLSRQRVRLLTFYIELREGPTDIVSNSYPRHSFVIKFKVNNHQSQTQMSMIGQKDIEVPEGEFICMLNYQNYLSAEALGETTIEKELNFWDSSEYFCSMPRKKFLQMMREANIRVFHQNETAFFQGQQVTKTESGSGVYIVRTGEFSYFRDNQGREIQSFRFNSGSIFGALQLLENSNIRSLTAKCKTQNSIIYHFSQETFRRLMARYCELVIKKKQQKLLKFIEKKEIDNMFKSRSLYDAMRKTNNLSETNPSYMRSTQFESFRSMHATERNAFPAIKLEELKQATNNKFFNTFKESNKMEAEGMKRSDYFSLRKDGPLKMYPMASQRSNFLTSEFKILDKLLDTRKEVGRELESNLKNQDHSTGIVWKRDMVTSFYRQNFYRKTKRNPEIVQQ